MRRKISIIIRGIIIPFALFIGVTYLVSFIIKFVFATHSDINSLLLQGIANFVLCFVLIPLYISFTKSENIKSGEIVLSRFYYMLAIAFSLCVCCNVLLSLLPTFPSNVVAKEVQNLSNEFNIGLSLVIVALIVPIVEELLFRGFIYDSIKLITNDIIAIIISAILFGIIHGNIEQGIYGFVAGLVLAFIKYKYSNIIYTIFIHIIMNLTTLVFVPSILSLSDFKSKMFVALITFVIFAFSIIRINIKK